MASVCAAPDAFVWERHLDALASAGTPEASVHWRVERWALDEFPMPAPLFEEVVEQLYRRDLFMRGELVLGGAPVRPAAITAPLLTVHDAASRVVPPESVLPLHAAVASREKHSMVYRGDVGVSLQHVGVLVGARAHGELWPAIFDWLG
jgi:polyhydroxyalkanoate synthase